jgi:hypothetical protein
MISHLLDEATLAIGVILLVCSWAAFRRTRTFIANCRVTDGYIAAYRTEDSDEGVSYFAVMRFRDVAGVEHEIGGAHGLQNPPKVGKVVSITYDPRYPTNAWVTGTSGPWFLPWLILIAGIATVAASVVVYLED